MNYGIIDIGSNTIRVVVYRVNQNKFECLFNDRLFVQLIGYVKNGTMQEEGIKNLICSLRQLQNLALRFDLKALRCFATAPFRAVRDPAHLKSVVKEFTGLDIDVLDGTEEALLGISGTRRINNITNGLFVDLGGGSVEISLLKEGGVEHTQSIDIGCVNLCNKFVSGVLPGKKELERLKKHIHQRLLEIPWLNEAGGLDMYCIGGTSRALGHIHKAIFGRDVPLNDYLIDTIEIKNVYKFVLESGVEGIRLLSRHCPGRIFTFVPGALVLWKLAKRSGACKVRFNTFGVREGYLIERMLSDPLFADNETLKEHPA